MTSTLWRGERLDTLADRYPPGCRAVVVALHPTPCGVQEGHHLHQRLGQQALRRVLGAAGVAPSDRPLDDVLVDAGIGVVTVVKRPAGTERGLLPGDVEEGREVLLSELVRRDVRLAICPFAPAARALLGAAAEPGVHDVGPLRVVRLAAPFAPAGERDAVLDLLRHELSRLG